MTEVPAPSPDARDRVAGLFAGEDVAEAERLLRTCTDNPLLIADAGRQGWDRMFFSMIRLSGGRLDGLREAIALFQKDWRDLLCAAGFGEDVTAHERWQPRKLAADVVRR